MSEKAEVKLNPCEIAKRGKGAKGTIQVETFGVPVKPKEGNVIAKWDYGFVESMTLTECIDKVESLAKLNQRLIKEAIFRGADLILKSASIQAQSAIGQMVQYILEQELAEDNEKAESLAAVWQQTQAFMKRSMMPIPSIEDLAGQRRKYVAEQKEKGLWNPTLVKEEDSNDSDENETETDSL